MPTGWDSILTIISFGDCYTDGLEMLLCYKIEGRLVRESHIGKMSE